MISTSAGKKYCKNISLDVDAELRVCFNSDAPFIVLVTDKGDGNNFSGVVVHTDGPWHVGMYGTTWATDCYKPYKQKVSLRHQKGAK